MKFQSYNEFWQNLRKTAQKEAIPLRVMLELTYACNFKCRHCYVPQSYIKKYSKKELKTKYVFSILDQLKDMGCFYLGFTGGEPFTRKDIIPILWYAKKKGFEIIIYTNGSLIDEKIANELNDIRPNKVDITIPAMSKKSFEAITGTADLHKKVFNAINHLYNNGVKLGFKSCLLKDNKSEIKDIQKFALSLNALHRLDDMPSPRLDGSKEPYKYGIRSQVTCNRHQVSGSREQVECSRPQAASSRSENLFYCGVGKTQAAITPAGELKMCLMIDYPKYNILKASLKECWCRLKKLCVSVKPDRHYECHKCDLKIYCNWCPASSWLRNKTFTACDPNDKLNAQTRYYAAHRD